MDADTDTTIDADQERDPTARQHSGKNVPPQLVEPEPMEPAGTFEPERQVLSAGSDGTSHGPTIAARTMTPTMRAPAFFIDT